MATPKTIAKLPISDATFPVSEFFGLCPVGFVAHVAPMVSAKIENSGGITVSKDYHFEGDVWSARFEDGEVRVTRLVGQQAATNAKNERVGVARRVAALIGGVRSLNGSINERQSQIELGEANQIDVQWMHDELKGFKAQKKEFADEQKELEKRLADYDELIDSVKVVTYSLEV